MNHRGRRALLPVAAAAGCDLQKLVAALVDKVRETIDLEVTCAVESGAAHAALLELASTRPARSIVVGASGSGAVNQALFYQPCIFANKFSI